MWYNGATLRYLRTPGLVLAAVVLAACASGSSSATAGKPKKIRIGDAGGVLVSAYGSLWTTDLYLDRLVRIDPKAAHVSGKVRLGRRPYGLAAGAGSIWVASQEADTLARVDPKTLKVVERIHVGGVNLEKILTPDERANKDRLVAALQHRLLQSALKDDQAKALGDFLSTRGQLSDADIRTAIRLVMCTPEYQVT